MSLLVVSLAKDYGELNGCTGVDSEAGMETASVATDEHDLAQSHLSSLSTLHYSPHENKEGVLANEIDHRISIIGSIIEHGDRKWAFPETESPLVRDKKFKFLNIVCDRLWNSIGPEGAQALATLFLNDVLSLLEDFDGFDLWDHAALLLLPKELEEGSNSSILSFLHERAKLRRAGELTHCNFSFSKSNPPPQDKDDGGAEAESGGKTDSSPTNPTSVVQIGDEQDGSSSRPATPVVEFTGTSPLTVQVAEDPNSEMIQMRAELDNAKSRLQDMDQVQKDLEAANKRLKELESLVQASQRNPDTNPTQEEAPETGLSIADFRTSCAPTILQYTSKGSSDGIQGYLWSTEGQLVVHANDKEIVATNVLGEVALLLGQAAEMNTKPSALFQLWVKVYSLVGETRTGFEVTLTKKRIKASSFEAVLQAAALLEQLATWRSAMLSSTSPITTHEHRIQAAVDDDEELGDEDPFEWSVVVEHFAVSAFYSIFAQCLTFGEPGLIAAMLHLSGVGDVEAWETSEDAQALTCCRAILALSGSPVQICCHGKVVRIGCKIGSCVFRFFAGSEAVASLLTEANQYFEHRRPTREEFHLPVSAKGGISFNDDAIRLLLDAVEVDRCLDF
eukprot:scaffold137_cov264-Pinguiococcus_pyrenoidosus.AAC.1